MAERRMKSAHRAETARKRNRTIENETKAVLMLIYCMHSVRWWYECESHCEHIDDWQTKEGFRLVILSFPSLSVLCGTGWFILLCYSGGQSAVNSTPVFLYSLFSFRCILHWCIGNIILEVIASTGCFSYASSSDHRVRITFRIFCLGNCILSNSNLCFIDSILSSLFTFVRTSCF